MGLRLDAYLFLVKQGFANFSFNVTKDAFSLVKGENLDLFVTSLNNLASALNLGKKYFEFYGWSGLFKVEPIQIVGVVMDDSNMMKWLRLRPET